MMSVVKKLLLFSSLLVCVTCQVKKDVFYKYYESALEVPDFVKIDNNLYIQKYEVSFWDFLNFQEWIWLNYGENSKQAKLTILDENCLFSWDECVNIAQEFNDIIDKKTPVVCVDPSQAKAYAKWYSDRVFETMLTDRRIIDPIKKNNSNRPFSIEAYFNDSLHYVIGHKKLTHYPRFRLPTIDEWEKAYYYSRLVDGKYFDNCNTDECKYCKNLSNAIWAEIDQCSKKSKNASPLLPVKSGCHAESEKVIYHLKGNVREISAHPGISLGGGWNDTKAAVLRTKVFNYDEPDINTGFRLVFEWVKW